jgi:hypothetical protein
LVWIESGTTTWRREGASCMDFVIKEGSLMGDVDGSLREVVAGGKT